MTILDEACKAFGWQGGTIHQVAQELGLGQDTRSLFFKKGDKCKVRVFLSFYSQPEYQEIEAEFIEYTGFKKDRNGHWLSCSVFAPGFNAGGTMHGLSITRVLALEKESTCRLA